MLLMLLKSCQHDTKQTHVQLCAPCPHADLPCELHLIIYFPSQHRLVQYLRQSRPHYCHKYNNLRNRLPSIRHKVLTKEEEAATRAHFQG